MISLIQKVFIKDSKNANYISMKNIRLVVFIKSKTNKTKLTKITTSQILGQVCNN